MVARSLWIAVVLFGTAVEASAQDQTVTYTSTSSGISDGGRNGCVGGDWWLQPAFPSMTFSWTDTTGAAAGKVRVEVDFRWAYYSQPALDLGVAINGVLQPEPLTSPTSSPTSCGQSEVTTSTHEDGITSWNALAQNSLTLTVPQGQVAVLNIAGAFMIRIRITKLNEAPGPPTLLQQSRLTFVGKPIPVGGKTSDKGVTLSAVLDDPDEGDTVHLEIEVQPTTVFFTGQPTTLGPPITPPGAQVFVSVPGLDVGSYHWQVRTVDAAGEASAWVSFGDNSEVLPDFTIDTSTAAVPPLDFEDHGSGDCALSASSAPRFVPGLALILAALLVRIRRASRA
jgi:hypothetical protein